MVPEKTRFYLKADMTSSWLFRQGALHAILHDGLQKSDHDFLIAFHCNFLSGMHGFRANEFYCQPDMTSSWLLRQGALHAHVHDGFWRSDHNFLIASYCNFYMECMVSEITRFYSKPDMTSMCFFRQGVLHAIFWLPILKGRPRFHISVAL